MPIDIQNINLLIPNLHKRCNDDNDDDDGDNNDDHEDHEDDNDDEDNDDDNDDDDDDDNDAYLPPIHCDLLLFSFLSASSCWPLLAALEVFTGSCPLSSYSSSYTLGTCLYTLLLAHRALAVPSKSLALSQHGLLCYPSPSVCSIPA